MGKKRFGSLLFMFFIVLCSFACESKTVSQTVDGSAVVAKVGNTKITVKEFERKYNSVPPQFKMFFSGEEGKTKFLDEIIKEKVLAEKAKAIGLDKKEDIKQIINDLRDNILAKEMFSLKSDELNKSINVKSGEVEKEIKESNSIARASHILIEDEKKAKEILERINKGEDFAKLAGELSEDPSAKRNNGDLGTFSRGDMVPEFDKAIFNLKIGEITPELVKTNYGYHIIKRTEPEKEDIQNRLVGKKQTDALNRWLEEIKKEIHTEINMDVLGKIKISAEAPGAMPHSGMPQGHGSR